MVWSLYNFILNFLRKAPNTGKTAAGNITPIRDLWQPAPHKTLEEFKVIIFQDGIRPWLIRPNRKSFFCQDILFGTWDGCRYFPIRKKSHWLDQKIPVKSDVKLVSLNGHWKTYTYSYGTWDYGHNLGPHQKKNRSQLFGDRPLVFSYLTSGSTLFLAVNSCESPIIVGERLLWEHWHDNAYRQ